MNTINDLMIYIGIFPELPAIKLSYLYMNIFKICIIQIKNLLNNKKSIISIQLLRFV